MQEVFHQPATSLQISVCQLMDMYFQRFSFSKTASQLEVTEMVNNKPYTVSSSILYILKNLNIFTMNVLKKKSYFK